MNDRLRITSTNKRYFRALLALKSYHSRRRHVFVARGSKMLARSVELGFGTRINGPALAKGTADLVIGRYCAIGHGVRFITSNHSAAVLNLNLALQERLGASRHVRPADGITVGHNVWIGDGAIILPGVTIGNGAIVGAGAVVPKSVGAYDVVVGNPARVIRQRVGHEVIELLESSRWWAAPESALSEIRGAFDLVNIDVDVDRLKQLLGRLDEMSPRR